MIYVSSSCIKATTIKDAVLYLCRQGIKNIELSSGTEFYDEIEGDLLELQAKYNLQYICHNYFPPNKEHFVLNLASLDDGIYERSIEQIMRSAKLSVKLGAKKMGFHAGFLIDIDSHEIGGRLKLKNTFNKERAIERFCRAVIMLQREVDNLDLYIENNMISIENKNVYKNINPLLLVNYDDYIELKSKLNFKLLLDVAHLKISSMTYGRDFHSELDMLVKETDYLHLSDNDGLCDQNKGFDGSSDLIRLLSRYDLSKRTMTLEIYEGVQEVQKAFNVLLDVVTSYNTGTAKGTL